MLGFASVASFWSDPNKELLDNLPLLERLDQYRQVDDIQFLRDLHAANLLKEVRPQPEEPTSLADRQALVQQMTADEKEILKDKQKRFSDLGPADQKRLEALHQELQRDPSAPELRGTMAAYYDWLLKQPLSQRGGLVSLDPAARLEKVKSLRKEELRREARSAEPADLLVISSWLEEQYYNRLPEDVKRAIDQLQPGDRNGALMLFMTRPPGPPRQPDKEAVAQLRERLSPAGRAKLDVLETDAERHGVIVGDWNSWLSQAIRDSIRRYFEGIAADLPEEKMVAYFEQLSVEQKDDLLKLQPDSRELRLRIMYVMEHRRERLPEQLRTIRPESLWWVRARRQSLAELSFSRQLSSWGGLCFSLSAAIRPGSPAVRTATIRSSPRRLVRNPAFRRKPRSKTA